MKTSMNPERTWISEAEDLESDLLAMTKEERERFEAEMREFRKQKPTPEELERLRHLQERFARRKQALKDSEKNPGQSESSDSPHTA